MDNNSGYSLAGGRRVSDRPLDRQRGEFLRSCRARISPVDLGLPEPQRRRTAGLRREDVAALSGVSVAWYTWLEQGRSMRVSDDVLERLSQTFRLDDSERDYLFSLVQQRPPAVIGPAPMSCPPELHRLIGSLSVPVIIMNLRWDVLAWNPLMQAMYRDYSAIPAPERNLVSLLFTHKSHYADPLEVEEMARRILSMVRVDFSRAAGDTAFEALIRHLDRSSPLFHRLWREPAINARFYGQYRFSHAQHGPLVFEHTRFMPDGYPSLRVVMCTPLDDATRQACELARARMLGYPTASA